jgi:hypothetical protein
MWTPCSRAPVGDFGAGQALTDEQYHLIAPLIPEAKQDTWHPWCAWRPSSQPGVMPLAFIAAVATGVVR